MPIPQELLFVGTHGHVVAIDKTTGRQVWRTSLPKTGYQVVSMIVEDDLVLCATAGRVFALDVTTGSLRWTNTLPGLGSSFVGLATANQSADIAALHAAAQMRAVQAAT